MRARISFASAIKLQALGVRRHFCTINHLVIVLVDGLQLLLGRRGPVLRALACPWRELRSGESTLSASLSPSPQQAWSPLLPSRLFGGASN